MLRWRQLRWQAQAARFEAEALTIERALQPNAAISIDFPPPGHPLPNVPTRGTLDPPTPEAADPADVAPAAIAPAVLPSGRSAEPTDAPAPLTDREAVDGWQAHERAARRRLSQREGESTASTTHCVVDGLESARGLSRQGPSPIDPPAETRLAGRAPDSLRTECGPARSTSEHRATLRESSPAARSIDRTAPRDDDSGGEPSGRSTATGRRQSSSAVPASNAAGRRAKPRRSSGVLSSLRDLRRPRGWHCSAGAHGALVLLLMWISLPAPPSSGLLELQASEPSEESDAPVAMMPEQPVAEPLAVAAPAAAEAPVDLPVLSSVDRPMVASGSIAAAPAFASAGGLSDAVAGFAQTGPLGAQTGAGGSPDGVEFFGIRGEGRNLCWVVDCSRSMTGQRFMAAREELGRALQSLRPDQRFSVIFYGQALHPMCLDGQRPEPFAVSATPENIARCREWMQTVELEAGGPPDDALAWALERRPEAIFLLTDGEFPARIEDWLVTANFRDSLFEPSLPISIIHTIGFAVRDGQPRLARIAARHGGQFRQVSGN
jgi:hypothetical protein